MVDRLWVLGSMAISFALGRFDHMFQKFVRYIRCSWKFWFSRTSVSLFEATACHWKSAACRFGFVSSDRSASIPRILPVVLSTIWQRNARTYAPSRPNCIVIRQTWRNTCFLRVLPSSINKKNVARRPGKPFYGRPYDDLQFLSPTILVIIDWTLLDRVTRFCVYAAEFENLCSLPKQRVRLRGRHWKAGKFEN